MILEEQNMTIWVILWMLLSSVFAIVLCLVAVVTIAKNSRKRVVGFFHPYTNDGGGGERVLWCAVKAIQELNPNLGCIIYTGDDASPQSLVERAVNRFGVNFLYPPKAPWSTISSRSALPLALYPWPLTLTFSSMVSTVRKEQKHYSIGGVLVRGIIFLDQPIPWLIGSEQALPLERPVKTFTNVSCDSGSFTVYWSGHDLSRGRAVRQKMIKMMKDDGKVGCTPKLQPS